MRDQSGLAPLRKPRGHQERSEWVPFRDKKGGRCFAKSSQLGPVRAFLPSESIGELPERHHHDWLLP